MEGEADDSAGRRGPLVERFVKRSRLAAPPEAVFRWHEAPDAIERLTPPWAPVRVLERSGGLEAGARVVLGLGVGPLRIRWVAEHDRCVPGREFRDVQTRGPFARWVHVHRFLPDGEGSILEDDVEWALPLGPLGRLAAPLARREITRLFEYRHRVTAEAMGSRSLPD